MNGVPRAALALLLGALAAAADEQGQSKPATPAQQYRALVKEQQGLPDDLASARTAEERKKVLARLQALPQRFLALAEKHPKDPVALDALVQVVAAVNSTAFPACGKDSPGTKALA